MAMTVGPQNAKPLRNSARSAGTSSIGKMPAMKKTNAYSRARMRRRSADWPSRSAGSDDEIPRASAGRASGRSRVTCSCMAKIAFRRVSRPAAA
jgi:hypothetical protein